MSDLLEITANNLKALRTSANMKQDELEHAIGVKRGIVSNWERGANGIPPKMAAKISAYFKIPLDDFYKKNLNSPVEIATSEGPITGSVYKNPLLPANKLGEAEVPYYDFDFMAGDSVEFYNDSTERPSYTMRIPGFAGCISFPSYGDSMEKLIRRGSILFGRKLEDWHSFLEFGQIYGIVMQDERRFLKYIRKAADPKNRFLLRSENDKYDDFEIPIKKIKNIWLIEGWMLKTA